MDTHAFYAYLQKARRDLWPALEAVPDEIARKPIEGGVWTSLKHLVLHTAVAEDAWLRADIQRIEPIQALETALDGVTEETVRDVAMSDLIGYWRRVEEATLEYLPTLTSEDLVREMTPYDDPSWILKVGDVLWHVMIHEVRHTAQMVMFLRAQGIKPPSLDAIFYMQNKN